MLENTDVPSTIRRVAKYLPKSAKKRVPIKWKKLIKYNGLYVKKKTNVHNVYHCCTHKSASQWIRKLLSDTITFKYSGLTPFRYQLEWMNGWDPRPYNERTFSKSFPEQTVCTPLYMSYGSYKKIEKPKKYRSFFVLRDPKDVINSWYFSMKYSHPIMANVKEIRKKLKNENKEDGMCRIINMAKNMNFFEAQKSWLKSKEKNVKLFKYEKLTGENQLDHIKNLFDHCKIRIPNAKIEKLIKKHRKKRENTNKKENKQKHRRKGQHGDWKNNFTNKVFEHYKKYSKKIVENEYEKYN